MTMAPKHEDGRGGRRMTVYLFALARRVGQFLAMLRAGIPLRRMQTAAARPVLHVAIASHTRRYPGRSSPLTLRQRQGWIDAPMRLAHQDRRA